MIIYEPTWKSYIVQSTDPVFSIDECNKIIKLGRSLPIQSGKVGVAPDEKGTGKIDHKIRQNKFFNANLLSVDGLDSLLSDVNKSSQFLEAIKGEFTTGVDASRVLDGFDPEGGEYTLRHQITESEAQDLKNILSIMFQ